MNLGSFCCVERFSVKPFRFQQPEFCMRRHISWFWSHRVSLGIKSRCEDPFEPLDLYAPILAFGPGA